MDTDTDVLTDSVTEDLKRDYFFSLFSLLPALFPDYRMTKLMARSLGLNDKKIDLYAQRLLDAGFWAQEGLNIKVKFDHLELGDISVRDYLAMTINIISRLSESKSYVFDTSSFVTSRPLVREFNAKVNAALRELKEKSDASAAKECIFSWSYTGLIEIDIPKPH